MKKYTFELLETDIEMFEEKDHVILANSLSDAIEKFVRKHDLEAPAYWDEPTFDTEIELVFKSPQGTVAYQISW